VQVDHVDHSKSQPMEDKLCLKVAWTRHVIHFKFLVPQNISGMAQSRDFTFCPLVVHVKWPAIVAQWAKPLAAVHTGQLWPLARDRIPGAVVCRRWACSRIIPGQVQRVHLCPL